MTKEMEYSPDRLSRIEAMIESNADAIDRLICNSEADREALCSYTKRTEAVIKRLDSLLDHLLNRK